MSNLNVRNQVGLSVLIVLLSFLVAYLFIGSVYDIRNESMETMIWASVFWWGFSHWIVLAMFYMVSIIWSLRQIKEGLSGDIIVSDLQGWIHSVIAALCTVVPLLFG